MSGNRELRSRDSIGDRFRKALIGDFPLLDSGCGQRCHFPAHGTLRCVLGLADQRPIGEMGSELGSLYWERSPGGSSLQNYIHIGVIHIAFNMWCLFQLGTLAERIFDRRTCLLIYRATGIAGSVANLWWHPTVVGAGASGAIFRLAGAVLAALYLGKLPIPREAVRATMKSLLIFAAYNLLFYGLRSGVDKCSAYRRTRTGSGAGRIFF